MEPLAVRTVDRPHLSLHRCDCSSEDPTMRNRQAAVFWVALCIHLTYVLRGQEDQ